MNKCFWWIVTVVLFFTSCETSPKKDHVEEKSSKSIEQEVRKFSLREISNQQLEPTKLDLIDTVFVSMLDSILEEQNLLAVQLDSQLTAFPKLIEDTKNRISNNTEQLEDSKFNELTDSWNNIIEGEKKTLHRFKTTYAEVNKLRAENQSLIDFMNKIPRDQPEEIAYFIVEAVYETNASSMTTIMLLNPEGELLKEFELH